MLHCSVICNITHEVKMSQVIRIPDSILKRLEKYAVGFDTPGRVIGRILDFYEKYHYHNEEITSLSPVSEMTGSDFLNSNKIEIKLTNARAKRKYALIPLSDKIRKFFPGYKEVFILRTDIGEIETKVTSAPKGTEIGDPEAGTYIQGGLTPWFNSHRNIKDGDILVIEKIGDKLYELNIK